MVARRYADGGSLACRVLALDVVPSTLGKSPPSLRCILQDLFQFLVIG